MAYTSPFNGLFSGPKTAEKSSYVSPFSTLFDEYKKNEADKPKPLPTNGAPEINLTVSGDQQKPAASSAMDVPSFSQAPKIDLGSSSSTSAIPPKNPVVDAAVKSIADWSAKPGSAQAALKTVSSTMDDLSNRFAEVKKVVQSPTSTIGQQVKAGASLAMGFINVAFSPASAALSAVSNIDTSSGANKFNPTAYALKFGAKGIEGAFSTIQEGIHVVANKTFQSLPAGAKQYQPTVEEFVGLGVMMLAGEAMHLTSKGIGEIAKTVSEIKDANGIVSSAADVLGMDTSKDALGRVKKPAVEDVKTAYRNAAQETHPDKGGTAEAFQTVNTAKRVLTDYSTMTRKAFTEKWSTPLEVVKTVVKGYLDSSEGQMGTKVADLNSRESSSGIVEQPSIDPTVPVVEKMAEPAVPTSSFNGKEIDTTTTEVFKPKSSIPDGTSIVQMRDSIGQMKDQIPSATDPNRSGHIQQIVEMSSALKDYQKANAQEVFSVPVGDGKSLAGVKVTKYEDSKFTAHVEAQTSGQTLFVPDKTVYPTMEAAVVAGKAEILAFVDRAIKSATSKSELMQLAVMSDAVAAHGAPVAVTPEIEQKMQTEAENFVKGQKIDLSKLTQKEMKSLHSELQKLYEQATNDARSNQSQTSKPSSAVSTSVSAGTDANAGIQTDAQSSTVVGRRGEDVVAPSKTDLEKHPVGNVPEDIAKATTEHAREWLQTNKDEIVNKILSQDGPKIIDNDEIKKMVPGSVMKHASLYHDPASEVVAYAFERALKEVPGDTFRFTAGGSGSGKSEILTKPWKENKSYDGAVLDGTMSNYETAKKRIRQVIDSGKEAHVFYVLNDVRKAWGFSNERAKVTGRTVPAKVFVDVHMGVIETMKNLAADGVKVFMIDARNLSLDEAKSLVSNGKTIRDPKVIVDILEKLNYSRDELIRDFTAYEQTTSTIKESGMAGTTNSGAGDAIEKTGNTGIQSDEQRSSVSSGSASNKELPTNGESRSQIGQAKDGGINKEVTRNKKSGVGKSIAAKALEKGLTDVFGDIAEYTSFTVKDQAARAADLINNDFERAHRIILGEEKLPDGLLAGSLIIATEDYIKINNDASLVLDLANSPLTAETSVHAQEMRILAERDPDSAVANIQQLKKVKMEAAKSKGKTKESVVKDIKEQIKKTKTKATKETWASFIDSITCK